MTRTPHQADDGMGNEPWRYIQRLDKRRESWPKSHAGPPSKPGAIEHIPLTTKTLPAHLSHTADSIPDLDGATATALVDAFVDRHISARHEGQPSQKYPPTPPF